MKKSVKSALPVIILVCTASLGILVACHKNIEFAETAITIHRYECSAENTVSKLRICYDSLTNDSRCPEDATCFWEGYAVIKIRLYENGNPHIFKMLWHSGNDRHLSLSNATSDTIINGYKIKLTDILPHPKFSGPTPTADQYKAIFSVSR